MASQIKSKARVNCVILKKIGSSACQDERNKSASMGSFMSRGSGMPFEHSDWLPRRNESFHRPGRWSSITAVNCNFILISPNLISPFSPLTCSLACCRNRFTPSYTAHIFVIRQLSRQREPKNNRIKTPSAYTYHNGRWCSQVSPS